MTELTEERKEELVANFENAINHYLNKQYKQWIISNTIDDLVGTKEELQLLIGILSWIETNG